MFIWGVQEHFNFGQVDFESCIKRDRKPHSSRKTIPAAHDHGTLEYYHAVDCHRVCLVYNST